MKLYNKQLSSLEALRGEKIRLRTELRYANKQDFNPLSELGSAKISNLAKGGVLGFVIDLLSAKSDFQTAATVAKPLLELLGRRIGKNSELKKASGGKSGKSLVSKIAKEIAVGYITGKAVQLALRGIKMYIQRRRKHRVSVKHLVM